MVHGDWKDLFKASGEGNVRHVRYHLEAGSIDPNFQHPEYFSAPIFEAIRAHQLDVVQILLDNGSSADLIEDLSGLTPLEMALAERQHGIVDCLLKQSPSGTQSFVKNILVVGSTSDLVYQSCVLHLLDSGHRVFLSGTEADLLRDFVGTCIEMTGNKKAHLWGSEGDWSQAQENLNAVVHVVRDRNSLIRNGYDGNGKTRLILVTDQAIARAARTQVDEDKDLAGVFLILKPTWWQALARYCSLSLDGNGSASDALLNTITSVALAPPDHPQQLEIQAISFDGNAIQLP